MSQRPVTVNTNIWEQSRDLAFKGTSEKQTHDLSIQYEKNQRTLTQSLDMKKEKIQLWG